MSKVTIHFNDGTSEDLSIDEVVLQANGNTYEVYKKEKNDDGKYLPDLDEELKSCKSLKKDEINKACQASIMGGFFSSALGTKHFFVLMVDPFD